MPLLGTCLVHMGCGAAHESGPHGARCMAVPVVEILLVYHGLHDTKDCVWEASHVPIAALALLYAWQLMM